MIIVGWKWSRHTKPIVLYVPLTLVFGIGYIVTTVIRTMVFTGGE